MRQLLDFAASPDPSCGEVNELLDRHIALVKQRVESLEKVEKQLVTLRCSCDGAGMHPCVILESFMVAADFRARDTAQAILMLG